MPELPDRPDIDQLRHQARELHRAATAGLPDAITRIRAYSDRVALATAQLAVAREYGYPSWPALRREVQRRRALLDPVAQAPGGNGGSTRDWLERRYSFGGGSPIQAGDAVLSPEVLTVGTGQAVLDVTAMLTSRLPATGARRSRLRRQPPPPPSFDDLTGTDDKGATYAARFASGSIHRNRQGEVPQPSFLSFSLDPVTPAGSSWIELRGRGGSATRLARSPQVAMRVSDVRAVAASEVARRQLDALGYWLLEGWHSDPADMTRACSAALARSAAMQQSGTLGGDAELPRQLARLCASLTEQRLPGDMPSRWQRFLADASRADGPELHLDITTALPRIDGLAMQLDHLVSRSDRWRLYLRALPGWWGYSEDGRKKSELVSVWAEDDQGGRYRSTFGGSTGHDGYEELSLRFRPRISPLARRLRLWFGADAAEVHAELDLDSAANPAASARSA